MKYVKRIIDKDLDLREQAFGAINILGPKGSGKTRTAKERCAFTVEFEDESRRDSYFLLADSNIDAFLNFPRPTLFDEWQDVPKIWGLIRLACDKEERFGQFYLTGSSSKKVQTAHTGTTRSIIYLQDLTLETFDLLSQDIKNITEGKNRFQKYLTKEFIEWEVVTYLNKGERVSKVYNKSRKLTNIFSENDIEFMEDLVKFNFSNLIDFGFKDEQINEFILKRDEYYHERRVTK